MDEKDELIIDVLKENSKLSSQRISKKTRIPITTVHHRIKKLEDKGIIRGYTILLDNKKIGKPIGAYILITVDYKELKQKKKSQQELAKKLRSIGSVEEAVIVTGGTDIILKLRVKNVDELNEFLIKTLRNVEGVEKTQTMVILDEY